MLLVTLHRRAFPSMLSRQEFAISCEALLSLEASFGGKVVLRIAGRRVDFQIRVLLSIRDNVPSTSQCDEFPEVFHLFLVVAAESVCPTLLSQFSDFSEEHAVVAKTALDELLLFSNIHLEVMFCIVPLFVYDSEVFGASTVDNFTLQRIANRCTQVAELVLVILGRQFRVPAMSFPEAQFDQSHVFFQLCRDLQTARICYCCSGLSLQSSGAAGIPAHPSKLNLHLPCCWPDISWLGNAVQGELNQADSNGRVPTAG
mmetsp:Transcript_35335/g.90384  ORF Transcript_35335/g.90384 Transcript_35335/m.90384 type:complete len:258 (-) Transcript_35335:177-950(-)